MIDLHCHIIPGIDDGAKNDEVFLEMARIAMEDGISTIIATPHHSRTYDNKIEDVRAMVELYNKLLKRKNMKLNIIAAQEIHIRKDLIKRLDDKEISTIGNTSYMLIELPFDKLPDFAIDIIYELRIRGITPIIAHPERYDYVIKDVTILNKFIEEGCLFQVNAMSIRGELGKKIKNTVEFLMKSNLVDFIASDSHNETIKKPMIKDVINSVDDKTKNRVKKNMKNLFTNNYKISKHQIIEKEREGVLKRLKKKFF
ncbi:MAG: CpsB/CapC family capsule biosynthesis tyrosine phosphatase [Clostridium sp.]